MARDRQESEWREEEEQEKRERLEKTQRREKVGSVLKKVWFFSSLAMVVGGTAIIAGTYGKIGTTVLTESEYDHLKSVNKGGWVMGGIGLGSLGIFYISGNRLRQKPTESFSRSSSSVHFSVSGLTLTGSF